MLHSKRAALRGINHCVIENSDEIECRVSDDGRAPQTTKPNPIRAEGNF